MSPETAITCRGLVKRYGTVTAVDGLDLEIRTGECFGLLGPNGAGKTTTVEILEGLLPWDGGEVSVLGRRWGQADRAIRAQLGIQLQETKLPEKLTVREVVRVFRSFYREGRDPEEILRLVGLEEKARAWVSKLSGGQRQRLAIGCALANDPAVLFLDEPTTGLDPQARRKTWEIVERFRARGRTVVLTTHYMEEAERLADRVAIIDRGKIIALGTPRELIRSMGGEEMVEFQVEDGDVLPPLDELRTIAGVRSAETTERTVRLVVSEVHQAVPALLARLEATGTRLSLLTTHHATLEDVFVSLTGRHLRDG